MLPSLVAAEAASAWEQASRPLPCRRVDGGQDRSRIWPEQGGQALCTLLGPFCQQPALQMLLRRLSRLEQLDPSRQRLWINRYRPGDQVPANRDVEGDCQRLVCLEAPLQPQLGGDLWIEGHRVSLRAGDAVMFAASQQRYGTSRIDSRRVHPSGFSRVTLGLRVFTAHGR